MTTDDQNTPLQLALELGRFDLDVASNARSHILADRHLMLSRDEDGLAEPWTRTDGTPASVWCNGPYSNPLPWCKRLRQHDGAWCSLWKMDSTTAWFAQLMAGCDGWAAFRKRIAFERAGNSGSADFASVLVWGGGWTPNTAVLSRLWTPRREQHRVPENVCGAVCQDERRENSNQKGTARETYHTE